MAGLGVLEKSVPAHVPLDLVVDFDVYRPLQPGLGYFESFKLEQDRGQPNLFWSPHNGGHWVSRKRAHQIEIFGEGHLAN